MKALILSLFVVGISGIALGAPTITPEGQITRGQSNFITFEITLSGIPADEATGENASSQTFFNSRVEVRFPSYEGIVEGGSNLNLPKRGIPTTNAFNGLFELAYGATIHDALVDPNDNTMRIYKFTVQILDVGEESFDENLRDSEGNVKLRFILLNAEASPNSNFYDEREIALTSSNAIAGEFPGGVKVQSFDRALSVTWTDKEEIQYDNLDDPNDTSIVEAPSGVTLVVVKRGEDLDLAAREPDSEDGGSQDSVANCRYSDTQSDGVGCLSCLSDASTADPIGKFYLDKDAIEASQAFKDEKIFIVETTESKVSISGLENDQAYRVIAVYEPNAVSAEDASCVSGTPKQKFTLEGYSDVSEAKSQKHACMITAAVHSTGAFLDLDHLRWIRDVVFSPLPGGGWFVDAYYRGSDRVVPVLGKSNLFNGFLVGLLTPLVEMIEWVRGS